MTTAKQHNTIKTMGLTAALGSFVGTNSSSRVQMLASHVGQAVPPAQSDIPRVMTGLETQLGDATFNIKMPTDAIVISVHRKYMRGMGRDAINQNPLTTIIYQCQDTGIYDYLDIYEYHTRHRTFGVKFIMDPRFNNIRPGDAIARDTILAASPNIKTGGIYATGMETNVIYLAVPGVIEDGFVVSEDYCLRAAPLEMSSSVVDWGRKYYPLNLYGDEINYKPFPDIGEKVRDDGLVFALREYDPQFDALGMTPKALMEVDYVHDRLTYGVGGATVYDVIAETGIGESRDRKKTPTGMDLQARRYIDSASTYYAGIRGTYDDLEKRNKRGLVISPKLQNLVTRCIADKPNDTKGHLPTKASGIIRRTNKNNPLDEFRIEIKYEKRKKVNLGSKITDRHGGKGVICAIWPTAHMPVDMDGNRADVIAFAKGSISRLNPGQFYEHYVNAASRDMSKVIRADYGKVDNGQLWLKLMAYYTAVAPAQAEIMIRNYKTDKKIDMHLQSIVDSGIYLYISPDEPHIGPDIFRNVEKVISPTYGPVTYTNSTGDVVTTIDSAFIGPKDMIILEKTDQKPMAVSSGTLQHHGVLGGATRESRNAHSSKQQAARVLGETEVRLIAATLGGDVIAELLDLANSPESHRQAVKSILTAKNPAQINELVCRIEIPLGNSRALAFVTHVLHCCGIEIEDEVLSGEV